MRAAPTQSLSALCALLVILTALPAVASATTQSEIDNAIVKGLDYAPTQHNPTTGEPPAYDRTSFYSGEWLASGYAAAGLSAADVRTAAHPSFQDFLFTEAASFWDSPVPLAPEYTGRLILTAHAAGIDTARVSASQNLPAELIAALDPVAGGFGEPNTFSTAWGTLALEGTALPRWALAPMLSYLRADQHADGGWSFYRVGEGEESNPDITAAALGALCTAGVPPYDPTVSDGLAYLHGLLVKETGAIEHPEFGPNLDTAAFAANALNACGIDPQSSAWTTADGKNPIDFILSLQLGDGGFPFFSGEPWFPPSTGHALRALAGDGFLVGAPDREDPTQPRVRPVPPVATGTPVPHVLAIEFAPGNVRLCSVTAPIDAPLTEVLTAAQAGSLPADCVLSLSFSGGTVAEINGVAPEASDESWLVRLDRGVAAVAANQPVGFGDFVSLWRGPTPPAPNPTSVPASPTGGPAGPAGEPGKQGKRGRRGRRGRDGRFMCKVRHRHHRRSGKRKARCFGKHREASKRKMELAGLEPATSWVRCALAHENGRLGTNGFAGASGAAPSKDVNDICGDRKRYAAIRALLAKSARNEGGPVRRWRSTARLGSSAPLCSWRGRSRPPSRRARVRVARTFWDTSPRGRA